MDTPNAAPAPAPWSLEERSSCVALVDANGQEILFLQKHSGTGENGSITARGRTNAEIDATARMLCAAPELFGLLLDDGDARAGINAPEDAEVLSICQRIGFGAVMDSAARQWRARDSIGAFTIGQCVATVRRVLARVRGVHGR